jgi:hypothetical protein
MVFNATLNNISKFKSILWIQECVIHF